MGISVICWAIFLLCFARNRSSYLNCPLLFIALTSSVPACCALAGAMAPAVFFAALVAFAAAILLVPFFLIINGIIMLRREGMSLPNMLSLFLGLAVGVGEIACVTAVLGPLVVGNVPSLDRVIVDLSLAGFLVGAAVLYGSLSFLMFALYSIFLMIIPRKRDYDYVIIHGAGLLDGSRISRLLAERLDKAIEVYRRDPTPPVLIPSDGRGEDETIPEAEAMARYLRERGIPEEDILREDRSTTTYENLVRSRELIDGREGRKRAALVTSNYHVYRAMRYCRKLGFPCTGIGSHVALYYWPSAITREYAAIHAEKKAAVIFLIGWILWTAVLFLGWISVI